MSVKRNTKSACPVCQGESTEKYQPFCSNRCADVDLNRWLDGNYRIPTEERPIGVADDDEVM